VYPEILEKPGYTVGLTVKGAGPCNFKDAGWPHNPAGAPAPDFETFSKTRSAKPGGSAQPFCF
jgi:hypothetical protein